MIEGLCEVVTRNVGLAEPIVLLFTRLLLACLSPNLVGRVRQASIQSQRNRKRLDIVELITEKTTVMNTTSLSSDDPTGLPPVRIDQVIRLDPNDSSGIRHLEHPATLFWCLQMLLFLPQFSPLLDRFTHLSSPNSHQLDNASTSQSQSSLLASQSSSQITQLTQLTGLSQAS
ncbi:unnamed protein product [Protopolystoma xenopodis]|uniref:Uncharacterized protein n=1 Tax=Protopolystoma xenopodis TaxID=117903 RepID=A0A3S5CB25_9PLAT|nr:unnamed protein product [Protopolystoma xenopodis]